MELNDYFSKIEPKINNLYSRKRNPYVYEQTIFGIDKPDIKQNLETAHYIRQIQMKEGDLGQLVYGNFMGWEDLRTGHESGLDIWKTDNSAIMELKNKYNTCNSSSKTAVLDKLAKYKKNNPDTRCILGVINPKNISSINCSKIEHDGVTIEILEGNELLDYIFTYNDYNYKTEVLDFVNSLQERIFRVS